MRYSLLLYAYGLGTFCSALMFYISGNEEIAMKTLNIAVISGLGSYVIDTIEKRIKKEEEAKTTSQEMI